MSDFNINWNVEKKVIVKIRVSDLKDHEKLVIDDPDRAAFRKFFRSHLYL